jgi:hypothetical protein
MAGAAARPPALCIARAALAVLRSWRLGWPFRTSETIVNWITTQDLPKGYADDLTGEEQELP